MSAGQDGILLRSKIISRLLLSLTNTIYDARLTDEEVEARQQLREATSQ